MIEHFPTSRFKQLIRLGGFYRANGRFDEQAGDDTCFGIPWSAIQRAELAPVVTTVAHVLDDARRHQLCAKHFPVWLAMETGIILLEGVWRYAFAEDPRIVMDDRQTARLFLIAEATARTYRDEFARALDQEWRIVTRYEYSSPVDTLDMQAD